MRFKSALSDGSDPLYSPCTSVTKGYVYWKAPKAARLQGYQPATVKLGRVGIDDPCALAFEARRLTLDMLAATKSEDHAIGTWAWLIQRYQRDDISPYQDVKGNTQEDYRWTCEFWLEEIGRSRIASMTYERIREAEIAMRKAGRSAAFIQRKMSGLRRIAKYGSALGNKDAREVSAVLSEIRFASGSKRASTMTRDQVQAIIEEADARGLHGFALGVLLQWTYVLRAVDVRGQWLPAEGNESGIVKGGQRWQDGLTWDMISPDLKTFRKVISKTERSRPEAMEFEITEEVRARLQRLGGGRIGPVITQGGLPYTRFAWAKTFSAIRKHLGMPETLWLMDARSGAITEAREMGADPFSIRDAAQHASITTTDRYVRSRSESAAKIVQLRARG